MWTTALNRIVTELARITMEIKEIMSDLPEQFHKPVPDKFKYFIADMQWHEAVTYRETAPHEYCLMREAPLKHREMFVEFARYIVQWGYSKYFYRLKGMYLDVGGYKYWTCDDPVEKTDLVNRAVLDDYWHSEEYNQFDPMGYKRKK